MGAHACYTRQWKNSTQTQRLNSAKQQLLRIGNLNSTFDVKLRLVAGATWVKALHAAGASDLSKKAISEFETAACRALGVPKQHTNPDMLIPVIGHKFNPEFIILTERIKQFRTMLDRMPVIYLWLCDAGTDGDDVSQVCCRFRSPKPAQKRN
jgi:hypothetical protein